MEHQKSGHNPTISIIKGICIILMVVGHSGAPDALVGWLSFCRMPSFFFASGFLFKDKYLEDSRQFTKRRFKGLWWVFVKWSLIFLLLHHVFYNLHIYNTDYGMYEYESKLFHIFTMTGSEQLLGGYWFLKDLLYGSMIGLLCLKCQDYLSRMKKIETTFIDKVLSGCILCVVLCIAVGIDYLPYKIPTLNTHAFLATAFYLFGVYAKRYNLVKSLTSVKSVLCTLAVLLVVSNYYRSSMSATGLDALQYYIVSLVGISMIYGMSYQITEHNIKCLSAFY